MNLKTIIFFVLIVFVTKQSYSLNIDSIHVELKNLEQNDKLDEWINLYFEIEEYYFYKNQISTAEFTCDSILLNMWRPALSNQENDALFKINWYKAYYLVERGEISEAKTFYEKALDNFNNSSKLNEEYLLYIYPRLGNIYTILGDNDKAIIVHSKMIFYCNKVSNYEGLVQATINLSIVYENQGNLKKAIKHLEEVLPIIDEVSNEKKAILYSNYGDFLFQLENYSKAKSYLHKAIKILLETDDVDTYYLGGIYKSLALLSIQGNNKKEANSFFSLSIENYKKSYSNRNREIAKIYLEKSKINTDKISNLDKALQFLIPHNGVFLNDFMPDKNSLFSENTLADVFYEATKTQHNPDTILKCFENYFEVQKLLRREYLFNKSKQFLLETDNKRLEEAIDLCYNLYKTEKKNIYAEKALEFIENSKSILLFESLIKKSNTIESEIFLNYISKKKNLIDKLIKSKLENNDQSVLRIQKEIDLLEFENEISTNSEIKKFEKNSKQVFSISDFKNNFLQNSENLIAMFDGQESIYIVSVSKDKSSINKVEKTNNFINNINAFSESLSFNKRFDFDFKLANYFGDIIEKNIPKNTRKLYIETDGAFNNIPFEVFRKKDSFFIEKYEIQYIFSSNILQNIEYKKNNNKEVLTIAPIFKNDEYKYLKKSEKEVTNIINLVKGEKLLNQDANTSNFLNKAKNYAVLHISSHAKIDNKLQTASIDFYDKSLYFSQIQNENFETDLLVLSACETGIGSYQVGEGSLSLSRAFAYTKIPSIISSLWKVNEESSSIIFDSFYKNIVEKNSISNALRNAKLSYLRNEDLDEEMKVPYYWSSFVLIGNDNVVEISEPNSVYVYIIMVVLGLLLFIILYSLRIILKA